MTGFKTKTGTDLKTSAYSGFMGLDTSRDITALDTGEEQHLSVLANGTCDWRGQIVRDPKQLFVHGERIVHHVRFFGRNEFCYAEEDGRAINLRSMRNHESMGAFPHGVNVTSTVFGRKVVLLARDHQPWDYDGTIFRRMDSSALKKLAPGFGTPVQRRLAVAGITGRETQVHFSRVDNADVFPEDEDASSVNVLRAGYIDIANLLGTAGQITGLGSFETNRLAIFTEDNCLLYRIDPDIMRWSIEDNAGINVGCLSHTTIANAGRDLLFCSRAGIHSLKRSETNGITAYSTTLTGKVEELYRSLVRSVRDPRDISAVWDADRAQYHVYFPQRGSTRSQRLTMELHAEEKDSQAKFSLSSFLEFRCGDFLGGTLAQGTPGGVYTALFDDDQNPRAISPVLEVITPWLWHGSLTTEKMTHSLILQASGGGIVELDAWDDSNRHLGSLIFELDDNPDDNSFGGVALSKQYERQWQRRYRAARYRIRVRESTGTVRIVGLAIMLMKD